MRAKAIIAALVFAAAPLTFALSITEIDINVSPLFLIGSAPPAGYGGPSPLLQTIGASMVITLNDRWYMEPGIELLGTYYEWTGTRAVPTGYETGTGFFTGASLIGVRFGAMFPVSSGVKLDGSAGLDFLIRLPFEQADSNALPYFYGAGRFIFPETRFAVRWQVTEAVGLVFSLRAMIPVFHIWDGEGLPFYDQLMAALTLGFVIRTGGQPAPAAPAAAPAGATSAK